MFPNRSTIGGGLNPIVNPAISTGARIAGVVINGSTLDAAGGNIVINGTNNSTFGTNNDGILITNTTVPISSRLLTSGAGTITLSGTSSTGGSNNRGIIIDAGTIIESANGNITLNGTGNGIGNSNYGIIVANDPILRTTGSGNLNLTGISNGNGLDNTGIIASRATLTALGTGSITLDGQSGSDGDGVSLISNSTLNFGVINTNNGNISITGVSRGTGSANRGVLIDGNARVSASNSGNVDIVGTGGNGTGDANQGILITGGNAVVEASNGNLTLTGTGNGSLNFSHGIAITSNALVRSTGTGSLSLTGVSNATGINNDGIFLDQSAVSTTSTGNIVLNGTSGTGNSQSAGISISGNSTLFVAGTISSVDGSIALTGLSRATGNDNQGVVLSDNATVTATNNTNNISITGTGGVGTNNNQGILVDLATSSISIGNGALTLTGTGRGVGVGNDGVSVNLGNVDAIGTGAITFTGFAPTGSFGILLSNANIKPTNTSGLLRLTGDEIDVTGTTTILGTGNLFLEPVTPSRNIIVGGLSNANDNNLEISNTLIFSSLQTGFTQVFIGRNDSSGLISLGNDVVLNNPVTLRSPLSTGAINTSGFNFRNITGNVTFLANQNITVGNIIAPGIATSLTSTTGAIDTSSGTIDTSNDGNGGNISFSSATGSTFGSLNTASSVIGNAGAIAFSNGNVILAGSSINASSNNGTAANLTFAFPVTLSSPTLTINTVSNSGTNGAVTFLNAVNGSSAGVNNLTINSGSGNIAFNNSVGSSTTPLGALFVNSTSTTRFNSTVNAASLITNAGGTTELNGNITTSGTQTFNDAVTLTNAVQLDTTNSAIAFNSTVNGAFNLSLNANTDSIIANAAFGDVTPLASLAIAPSSTLRSNTLQPISITTTGNISTGRISNPNTSISLTSKTGVITTGDVNTSGNIGGQVFFNAATAIKAGRIETAGTTRAGNVILDPSGDVVVTSIDASSPLQGGNVTLVSTGGNLIITSPIASSITASCVGASICTSGGTGGNITLQTGGLNPFVVGDAEINGSSGILTTGLTTVTLGTSIPALLGSSFTQGSISVTPGGSLITITTRQTTDNTTFEPPKKSDDILIENPDNAVLLAVRDIFKKDADRYFKDNNLAKAFEAIERAYVAELEIFTNNSLGSSIITIENAQDLLSTVTQQTGDVAALIYPVLLDNRIEILVIPPKEKGKPFRRFTNAANQEAVETLVTEYRNNLRDVGSNDYLEQSQKLYDLIIRPIDQQLTAMKINTLVFVMDSSLRVAPPAALHDGKQFLIERYAIANIPAMRAIRLEERDRKATRILAMGLTESVEGFSALPSVDIEIKTISSEVLKGVSFLNKEFTISNLQNQRQQGTYSILHLGTHAKFISDTSKESFIQFWDSQLKLSQIPKLRFDSPAIDMLTLSACQTAVGNNLGISGLAVESGAKSVLASLWEVSDVGTAPLMISFYKAFPDANNKAQAIQQAQINLLKSKVSIRNNQIMGIEGFPNIPLPSGSDNIDLSHPFYWSSFILVGNWL